MLQSNRGQKAYIKKRVSKAAAIMGKVWGIRKRKFGEDWEKRL